MQKFGGGPLNPYFSLKGEGDLDDFSRNIPRQLLYCHGPGRESMGVCNSSIRRDDHDAIIGLIHGVILFCFSICVELGRLNPKV